MTVLRGNPLVAGLILGAAVLAGVAVGPTIPSSAERIEQGPPAAPCANPPAQSASPVNVTPSTDPTKGSTVSYPTGWNILAAPPGTIVSGATGPLYTFQPGSASFISVSPQDPAAFKLGFGYWAFFGGPATVTLAVGSGAPVSVTLPKGMTALVGNPSGVWPALVSGATALTFDPVHQAYVATKILQPGQGAWACPKTDADVTVTITPANVVYHAGWNLIAGVPGMDLSSASPPFYTLQPGDTGYQSATSSGDLKSGAGYWANFAADTPLVLPAGKTDAYTVSVPAGQYAMVGNPSGKLPATVQGADEVLTYDPVSGYKSTTTLAPGQGAWVMSAAGGTVTVRPSASTTASPPAYCPLSTNDTIPSPTAGSRCRTSGS